MRSTGASFDITRGLATASPITQHGGGKDDPHAEQITVTFIEKDGTNTVVKATVGQSMLEVAHKNDIELEGACEGSLACSTCHVIIDDQTVYDSLPEPDDDENDMLDLAFGLTETSRLGCQVIAAKELDGMVCRCRGRRGTSPWTGSCPSRTDDRSSGWFSYIGDGGGS